MKTMTLSQQRRQPTEANPDVVQESESEDEDLHGASSLSSRTVKLSL